MTLPSYPKYKPSGVEWLGEIPEDWEVRRLKFDISKAGSGVTPKGGANVYQSSGIPLLRSQNIHFDGLRLDDVAYIAEDVHESMGNSKVLAGDVLLNITGASIGRCYFFDGSLGEANVNQHVCIIRPESSLLTRYLHYYLWSNVGQHQIQLEQSGSGREGLNFAVLKNFILPVMDTAEQKAIADYLDRKTGQIDGLIGKKKELISTLKEQRTAIITAAVTGKLPEARGQKAEDGCKMKNSGVEWLGQIPEHWEIGELFRITSLIQTGPFGTQLHQSDYIEDGIPLINPAHIVKGTLMPDTKSTVTEETVKRLKKYCLHSDDLVFARRGEVGRCGIVMAQHEGWLCGTGSMIVRLENSLTNYYAYFFQNSGFIDDLTLHAVGTTMLNINPTIVGRRKVLIPPKQDQQAIVDFLDQKTGQIDGLIGKTEEAIHRLEEYRTAIITAAVTGKVKVDDASSFVANEQ